jgi:acetyltransferase
MQIERFTSDRAARCLPDLTLLIQDAVDGGASVGFLPPLSKKEAEQYWRDVVTQLSGSYRILLAALAEEQIIGAVQLQLESRANGSHRAEVSKLLVHSAYRRQGIGRALMLALEEAARQLGRTTLVLDTRQGDPSEHLYRGLGYQVAGVIPAYARSADGSLHATVFLYKLL